MLSQELFQRIMNYFDRAFWSGKTNDSGWNYYGLTLDWYFENSVLSVEYLGIEDYFLSITGYSLKETEYLSEQFRGVDSDDYLKIIQCILQILNYSHMSKDQSSNIIQTITNVLRREKIEVEIENNGVITIKSSGLIGFGSYCNIFIDRPGMVRKELRPEFAHDDNLCKRLKYEHENMSRLAECPFVLKVYEFNEQTCSYIMEQGEINLAEYLFQHTEITYEERVKIILCLLKGLAFAHERQIIHRDLHPGNILKVGSEFVVCDFGLSKDLSKERSIRTSATQKNNHIYLDSIVISDFTKADMRCDVYSIGKLIDYIMLIHAKTSEHPFCTIVEICTSREAARRYESAGSVLRAFEETLNNLSQYDRKQKVIQKLIAGQYDQSVHEYIISLIQHESLCSFLVEQKFSNFGQVLVQFDSGNQNYIMSAIHNQYASSTGYGGWSNYDIFAKIAYFVFRNTTDIGVQNIAREIIKECAEIRYFAQDLLKKIGI